jgi:hypothetical protein
MPFFSFRHACIVDVLFPLFAGLRVEVSMVIGMMTYQPRSHPFHGEWSLHHHLRRMPGFGDHNRVKAQLLMILP